MRLLRPARERWLTPVSYTPLLMIYGLLALSYYVFVVQVQLGYYIHRNRVGAILLLVVYHILLLLVVYTYTRLILRQPGFSSDIHCEMTSLPSVSEEVPLVSGDTNEAAGYPLVSTTATTPYTTAPETTPSDSALATPHETGIITTAEHLPNMINNDGSSRTGSEQTLTYSTNPHSLLTPSSLGMPTASIVNDASTSHLNEHDEHTVKTTPHMNEPALTTDNIQQQQQQQQHQHQQHNHNNELYQSSNTPSSLNDHAVTSTNHTGNKRIRYCHICQRVKPDRAHHCSQCNECVLRMDHHCPWVVGCVGYGNHKLFFLFLFYVSMLTLYVSITIAIMLALYMDDPKESSEINGLWVALAVLAGIWSLMLVPFTGMHAFQLFTNQTTLEYMKRQTAQRRLKLRERVLRRRMASSSNAVLEEDPDMTEAARRDEEDLRNPWHQGLLRNWMSIMGDNPWLWLVPISNSLGDGVTYPRTDDIIQDDDEQQQRRHSPTTDSLNA
ncbi:DHHC palmitoyltransferase-domain-containing protein [Syncephalis plumigaleata]|nr:DHHC palmitoyltransferase-domain-containing protein [Syncephalis plumigaleata]